MITSRLRNQFLALALSGAALIGTTPTVSAGANPRADTGQDAVQADTPQAPAAPAEPATPAAPATPATPATPAAPAAPATPATAATRAARQARPASAIGQTGTAPQGQPGADGAPLDNAEAQPTPRTSPDRTAFRLGSDYTLMPDDVVDDVVMIAGSATIEGHVTGDLVVVAGSAHLTRTAVVDGDVVIVGGSAAVEAGANVDRDFVVVMGALEAPSDFRPGGEQTVVGPLIVGDGLRAVVPWLATGLLWGRPIVPSLPWVWTFVAVFFAAYLLLNLVFDRPVRACADKLAERPLSAFMVGLLVLVLLAPVSVLLAASIVGIALIPFLLCAVFVAGLLGKVSVLRTLGATILHQDDPGDRRLSARSFVLGFVAVTLLYMVPVLGIVGWATLGVLGLGASTMAFAAGLRRENPRPAAPVRMAPPPPLAGMAPAAAGVRQTGGEAFSMGEAPAAGATIPPPVHSAEILCFPRATFLNRLGAFVLDLVLVLLTYALLDFDDDGPGRVFLLLLIYHVTFWTWKGTTVGGIISQLRVVRTDGEPLRFVDAVVRGLSSVFSIVVLGLGCLWILRDPERQAWHDRIAGTYVVKVPRHYPLG